MMSRRNMMLAAPVVPLVASTVDWSGETPVSRFYRQWRVAFDHANENGISDEECNSRSDRRREFEALTLAAPTASARDLVLKVIVASIDGEHGLCMREETPQLWAEIERLGVA